MKIYDNRYNARDLRYAMMGKTYDQLSIGETAKFSKTISESDIYLYAGITGDFNPGSGSIGSDTPASGLDYLNEGPP